MCPKGALIHYAVKIIFLFSIVIFKIYCLGASYCVWGYLGFWGVFWGGGEGVMPTVPTLSSVIISYLHCGASGVIV